MRRVACFHHDYRIADLCLDVKAIVAGLEALQFHRAEGPLHELQHIEAAVKVWADAAGAVADVTIVAHTQLLLASRAVSLLTRLRPECYGIATAGLGLPACASYSNWSVAKALSLNLQLVSGDLRMADPLSF